MRLTIVWRVLTLSAITLIPLVVVLGTAYESGIVLSWQLFGALAPSIVLWYQFCYGSLPAFRTLMVKTRARILNDAVQMSISARLIANPSLDEEDVIKGVRNIFAAHPDSIRVDTLASTGELQFDLPGGWHPRLKLVHLPDAEYDIDQADEAYCLYISVPYATSGTNAALRLIRDDVSTFLESLLRELQLRLVSIDAKLHFVNTPNPFLSTYLQNVDTKAIKQFECTLNEPMGCSVHIHQSSVTIAADSISSFVNAVYRHL